ncbi:MAG: hypothetical protein GY705_04545, partial [Bacteroidetes bacterium]|nr:hypothetical protein [Bacteroidota bacterium]
GGIEDVTLGGTNNKDEVTQEGTSNKSQVEIETSRSDFMKKLIKEALSDYDKTKPQKRGREDVRVPQNRKKAKAYDAEEPGLEFAVDEDQIDFYLEDAQEEVDINEYLDSDDNEDNDIAALEADTESDWDDLREEILDEDTTGRPVN